MELLCQFVLIIILFNTYKLNTNENQNNTIDFSSLDIIFPNTYRNVSPLPILKCGIS